MDGSVVVSVASKNTESGATPDVLAGIREMLMGLTEGFTAQASVEQACVVSPAQFAPPLAGVGLVQVLVCVPV